MASRSSPRGRQAALADRLVLSKTDLAGLAEASCERLAMLNPGAPMMLASGIAPASLFTQANPEARARAWLGCRRRRCAHRSSARGTRRHRNFTLQRDRPAALGLPCCCRRWRSIAATAAAAEGACQRSGDAGCGPIHGVQHIRPAGVSGRLAIRRTPPAWYSSPRVSAAFPGPAVASDRARCWKKVYESRAPVIRRRYSKGGMTGALLCTPLPAPRLRSLATAGPGNAAARPG